MVDAPKQKEMHMDFKPLLATDFDEKKLRFPGYVSPKLDGIRALVRHGELVSRNFKPIKNDHVRNMFKGFPHLDGELIYGSPTAPNVYNVTNSAVTTKDSVLDVDYYLFDHIGDLTAPFTKRHDTLREMVERTQHPRLHLVEQRLVRNLDELLEAETHYLELGYEGAMYRDPMGGYKFGRSTVNEGILLKIKRFSDAECRIVGFEEMMANNNEAKLDELGRTKRSSHKENKSGKGLLGAFVVVGINGDFKDVEFNVGIGQGMDMAFRQKVWDQREAWMGKVFTYTYFSVGSKDKPRFPKWKGLRDEAEVANG